MQRGTFGYCYDSTLWIIENKHSTYPINQFLLLLTRLKGYNTEVSAVCIVQQSFLKIGIQKVVKCQNEKEYKNKWVYRKRAQKKIWCEKHFKSTDIFTDKNVKIWHFCPNLIVGGHIRTLARHCIRSFKFFTKTKQRRIKRETKWVNWTSDFECNSLPSMTLTVSHLNIHFQQIQVKKQKQYRGQKLFFVSLS